MSPTDRLDGASGVHAVLGCLLVAWAFAAVALVVVTVLAWRGE